nr:DUF998 domain-containing protein [Paracoccus saliphilus]
MHQHSSFAGRAGVAAILSCIVVAVADIIAWSLLVDHYSPVRNTISALAVGPGSWLLDLGLWVFAVGCLSLGVGMLSWDRAVLWRVAAVLVMLLAPAIGTIALFNEYAGQRNLGADIHIKAVYTLGVLVALAALLAIRPLAVADRLLGRSVAVIALLWLVMAPLFFIIPDGWDGAYERGLALMLLTWVALLGTAIAR